MNWKPELDELARREAFAREMGGVDKVKRQHGVSLPRQMPAVLMISDGTAGFHRPAMCRSGRNR